MLEYFLQKTSRDLNLRLKRMTPSAIKWCLEYPWPGNIRELKNAIEKIYLESDNEKILPSDFSFLLEKRDVILEETTKKFFTLKEIEKLYISRILQITRGNKTKASEILGISRKTLYEKIKKLKI